MPHHITHASPLVVPTPLQPPAPAPTSPMCPHWPIPTRGALVRPDGRADLSPELVEEKGATHRLYLESANTVSLDAVTRLLSSIFEEVVELGRSFNRQTPDANGGGGGGSSAGGGEASS